MVLYGALVAGVAAIVALAWGFAERVALDGLEMRAQAALRLRAEAISGRLAQYQPLASIYAQDTDVIRVLSGARSAADLGFINDRLETWNAATGAADTYLLNADGVAVAASNWKESWSFVGNDYSFRPYFEQALQGRLGRYFALGTQSGKRGYYFSHPVRSSGDLVGVVVVKVAVDLIEQEMRTGESEVFVTNDAGVILLAGHPAWRLKSLGPLAPEARARIAAQRQFDLEALAPVAFDGATPAAAPPERFVSAAPDKSSEGAQEMLHLSRPMTIEDWTLHLFVPTVEARSEARAVAALAGAVALVIVLAALVAFQNRARLLERVRERERAKQRMERAVLERTADLRESNALLATEVETRRAAEEELRKTQHDLIQAGKLAALGQMSTSLSHEFNQPLAAIRAYAENAVAFLKLGRQEDVADNLDRISKLTQRMAELSRNLTSFARKPRDTVEPTALAPVLAQSLELLQGRLERAEVELRYDAAAADIRVSGGPTRLQQVFVNIVGNAIDACAGQARPVIEIAVIDRGDVVDIDVADNGVGVPEELEGRIFDPFFTTKDAGAGLGLGLSISFNIVRDFGGAIKVARSELGGARFRIRLRAAPAEATVTA